MRPLQNMKAENSALYLILPMIQELKRIGYANVRFYSYERWTFSLAVVLYQEMPFKARSGEALVYPSLFWGEYSRDMAPKDSCDIESGLNKWARDGISVQDAATRFAEHYLKDQIPAVGCYSDEYYPWLSNVIAACPHQSFPVTEEPVPGGDTFSGSVEFYGIHEVDSTGVIPRPPGLDRVIEPRSAMEGAIAWNIERAKPKEPSGFQKWYQKHNT